MKRYDLYAPGLATPLVVYDPANGNEGNPIETADTQVTYTGLTPGEIYTFTLYVIDTDGNRNRWDIATVVCREYNVWN